MGSILKAIIQGFDSNSSFRIHAETVILSQQKIIAC
jgi:hypothetical protein